MHYEWLREPQLDMNCLLCWGPDTLVIAFRGTQSLANIKADAKVGAAGGCLRAGSFAWPTLSSCRCMAHTRPLAAACSFGARRIRPSAAWSCWEAGR